MLDNFVGSILNYLQETNFCFATSQSSFFNNYSGDLKPGCVLIGMVKSRPVVEWSLFQIPFKNRVQSWNGKTFPKLDFLSCF